MDKDIEAIRAHLAKLPPSESLTVTQRRAQYERAEKYFTGRPGRLGELMANQVNRRDMERWLRDHGFTLVPGKKTGHVFYVRDGVKVTLPGHGPQDLTKKMVALILRQLEMSGFNKEQVRRELDT